MCLSTIHIANPTHRFQEGVTKHWLDVPCGHCLECRTQKQDEWLTRSLSEFDYYKNAIHGSVWFPTLTYNNENLPFYTSPLTNYKIPCFDRQHIRTFMRKLRIYLQRAHYDSTNIKYLVCSEYGTKRGRSHYHMLLFLPFKISQYRLQGFLNRAWIYGFTSFSRKGGQILTDKAIKYCTKYVTKDMSFYQKYNVVDYLKQLKSLDEVEEIKNFRRILPFHLQSVGFGLPLLSSCFDGDSLSQQFLDNKISFSHLGDSTSGYYPYPDYIKNKVLKTSKNGITEPTVYSIPYYEHKFNKSVENLSTLVDKCKTYCYMSSVSKDIFPLVGFKNYKEFCDFISKSLHGHTSIEVALYGIVYRNVGLLVNDKFSKDLPVNAFPVFDKLDLNFYLETSFEHYLIQKLLDNDTYFVKGNLLPDRLKDFLPEYWKIHSKTLLNSFGDFKFFELCLTTINKFFSVYSKRKFQANNYKNLKNKEIKDSINQNLYHHV